MSSASAEVAARIARLEEELLLAKEVSAGGRGAASGTAEMLRVERELAAARAEIAGARGGSETAGAARANAGAGPVPAKATATTAMAPEKPQYGKMLAKKGTRDLNSPEAKAIYEEYLKEAASWKSQYEITHYNSGHPKTQQRIDFEHEVTHNRSGGGPSSSPPPSAADAARGNAGAAPAPAPAAPAAPASPAPVNPHAPVDPHAPRPTRWTRPDTAGNPAVPPTVGTPPPVQTGLPPRHPLGSPANPRPAPTVGTPAPVPTGLGGFPPMTGTTQSGPFRFYDPRTWSPAAKSAATVTGVVGAHLGVAGWAINNALDRAKASGAASAGTGTAGTGTAGTGTAGTGWFGMGGPNSTGASGSNPVGTQSGQASGSNPIAQQVRNYQYSNIDSSGRYKADPRDYEGLSDKAKEMTQYFNNIGMATSAQSTRAYNAALKPIDPSKNEYVPDNYNAVHQANWRLNHGGSNVGYVPYAPDPTKPMWKDGAYVQPTGVAGATPAPNLSSKSKIGTVPQEDIDELMSDQSIANINRFNAKHGENAHLKHLTD